MENSYARGVQTPFYQAVPDPLKTQATVSSIEGLYFATYLPGPYQDNSTAKSALAIWFNFSTVRVTEIEVIISPLRSRRLNLSLT